MSRSWQLSLHAPASDPEYNPSCNAQTSLKFAPLKKHLSVAAGVDQHACCSGRAQQVSCTAAQRIYIYHAETPNCTALPHARGTAAQNVLGKLWRATS
jgi:hypothetical protein